MRDPFGLGDADENPDVDDAAARLAEELALEAATRAAQRQQTSPDPEVANEIANLVLAFLDERRMPGPKRAPTVELTAPIVTKVCSRVQSPLSTSPRPREMQRGVLHPNAHRKKARHEPNAIRPARQDKKRKAKRK